MKFVTPPAAPKTNVLLYGAPKSGKSTAAASAPGPVLYLNTDLPNATWFAHRQHPGLLEVQYEGFHTMVEIVDSIQKKSLDPVPQTVVIDPVSELYRRLLEELSQRAVAPSLPTYGAVGVHVERFCRALCEADVNVVFICHDLPVKDESNGEVERLPATGTTNPALGRKLMGMVDIVGFTAVMEKDDGGHDYVAQLVNAKGRRGGDRFNVLGAFRPLDLAEWFSLCHDGADAPKEDA